MKEVGYGYKTAPHLIADKKEYQLYLSRARNRRWLDRKKAAEAALTEEFNQKRAELNLPAVTLKFEHECPFKGGKRPNYDPPPEMLAKMSPEDVSLWRTEERKRRKRVSQRLNRARKKEMLKIIKQELPMLKSKVEEKKQTKEATSLIQLQNGPLDLKGMATSPQMSSAKAGMNLKSEMVEVLELKATNVEAQGSPGIEKVSVKLGSDISLKHDSQSLDSAQVLVSSVEEGKNALVIDTEPKTNPSEEMLGLGEVAEPKTNVRIDNSIPDETANKPTPPDFFVHHNTKVKTKFGYLLPVVFSPEDFE